MKSRRKRGFTPPAGPAEAQRNWLVANGLPLLVPARERSAGLLQRVAPAWTVIGVFQLAYCIEGHIVSVLVESGLIEQVERGPVVSHDLRLIAYVLLALAWPVLALVVGLWLTWLSARGGAARRRVFAIVSAGVALGWAPLTWPWLTYSEVADSYAGFVALISLSSLVALAGTWWSVWAGIGAIAAWSARRAARESAAVLPLLTRALPVLVITLLFCFFNAEIWQVASAATWPVTWAMVVILAVLSFVLVSVVNKERLADMTSAPLGPERAEELLEGTPFTPAATAQRAPSRSERLNLILIPTFAQVIQTALFMVLVATLLLAFAGLAVPASLVGEWSSGAPHDLIVWGVKSPLGREYVQVAVILAAFAGLSFAASTCFEDTYRKTFVDPLMVEIERDLAARQAWLAASRSREP